MSNSAKLFSKIVILAITLVLAFSLSIFAEQSEENAISSGFARAATAYNSLKTDFPGVQAYRTDSRITRLYGQAFSFGSTPEEAAESFCRNYSLALNANPADLQPYNKFENKNTLPLMYNPSSKSYKFTLVYYRQVRNDTPVFQAELRLLIRNEPGFPVVLAVSSLRELGDFAAGEKTSINFEIAKNAINDDNSALTDFSGEETVIWAGTDDANATPRTAVKLTARNDFPENWEYVIDAVTGEILYKENLIVFENITGSVSGLATSGTAADYCAEEVSTPLPYARISNGTNTTHTDINGNFVLTNSGTGPIDVYSEIYGIYFIVYNFIGTEPVLSQTITPPGPADFLHNPTNTEYIRSQVNAYIQANLVRDLIIKNNPSYPYIAGQSHMPIYVNRDDGYCPANAWYDPGDISLNFCSAAGGYPNTAWSTIIHHEYGHLAVDAAGSGQGQYGEGMGDVLGILMTDESGIGYGFYGNCAAPLRDADNSMQYPCDAEIHICGKVLSGCIWDTRNELMITEPGGYLDTLAQLAINSILLHTGTQITPQITIDFLILDDNDANLNNGTPHYQEICAAFGAHNMECPDMALLMFEYPDGTPEIAIPDHTTSFEVQILPWTGTPVPGSGKLYYAIDNGAYAPGVMAENIANNYTAQLPAVECEHTINWFITATATGIGTVVDPDNAPANHYSTIVATSVDTIFEDNFETNNGWTVTGTVTDGAWNRGLPLGGGDRGDPPTDFDGSGQCFLTDNADDDSDVDGGTTSLISPLFDLSAGDALIHYARWYSNSYGADPYNDVMRIFISNNNGGSWIIVDSAGPANQADGGWNEISFWAGDFMTPTGQMRLRFDAADSNSGSVIEAGIDDVRIRQYLCVSNKPYIETESIANWTVNRPLSTQLIATNGTGTLTWSDKFNNLSGSGLTLSSDGLLAGIPAMTGPMSFTAHVEDETALYDERLFLFTINSPPIIITENLPEWTAGIAYDASLTLSGGTAPYVWTDKYGALAGTGLTLSSSGILSGIPSTAGTINLTAQAADAVDAVTDKLLPIVINSPVTIVTASLPDGEVDTPYSYQLELSGGTGTKIWSDKFEHLGGSGLTLSSTGLLSGIPLTEGLVVFTARTVDALGGSDEALLSIDIKPSFVCGDANGNGVVNLLDITFLISYVYLDGPEPNPMESADVNHDTRVNLLDITYLIGYIYNSGPEPNCP